ELDVGEFDLALDQIPPGKRVIGLIFDSASPVVNRSPYLHFASYYQVKKGGMVMFAFSGYPHWPTFFLPHAAPPPTSPRRKAWEWEPWYVSEEEDMHYFDYALVRAAGPKTPPPSFDVVFQGPRWGVWKHVPR